MILILAMLLDAALGEPKALWSRVPHPVVLIGRGIDYADRRFNRGRYRRAKGAATLALLIVASVGAGRALQALPGPWAEIVIGAILIAQRSLCDHIHAVETALRATLPKGRAAVAMIVGRDTSDMTESDVARAAIESAAENLSDGVIAPVFWFAVAGLPGLIAYKTINTADSMIGHLTDRHRAFGWAAARTDDLVNLIPARLTALLLWLPQCRGSLAALRRDAAQHRSPNAGWPEAAMARALGIALSGPRSYHGQRQDLPWVNGTGRRALTPVDIAQARRRLWHAWGFALAAVVLLSLGAR